MTGPPAAARVIFLGTGNAVNLGRFQSAIVVEAAGLRVLLDTGGGLDLVRRLLATSIDPASIGLFFLSHRPLDHVGGLEPFLLHRRSHRVPARRGAAGGEYLRELGDDSCGSLDAGYGGRVRGPPSLRGRAQVVRAIIRRERLAGARVCLDARARGPPASGRRCGGCDP